MITDEPTIDLGVFFEPETYQVLPTPPLEGNLWENIRALRARTRYEPAMNGRLSIGEVQAAERQMYDRLNEAGWEVYAESRAFILEMFCHRTTPHGRQVTPIFELDIDASPNALYHLLNRLAKECEREQYTLSSHSLSDD